MVLLADGAKQQIKSVFVVGIASPSSLSKNVAVEAPADAV
jgi:hypothetical protein